MKGRILIIGVLVLGLILAGCTRGGEETASAEKTSGASITVNHKYGSTEIPANPQRTFVTLQRYADPLLALGIKPATIAASFSRNKACNLIPSFIFIRSSQERDDPWV